jgi:hypothetical protein
MLQEPEAMAALATLEYRMGSLEDSIKVCMNVLCICDVCSSVKKKQMI